jgi:hypothetical protein
MPTATATKWTRGTVMVNWKEDHWSERCQRPVEGIILGNLGVVANKKLRDWGHGYRITHLGSGLGFGCCGHFDRLRDAKATVETVLAIEGAAEMIDACGRGEDYDAEVAGKVRNLVRRMYAELNR